VDFSAQHVDSIMLVGNEGAIDGNKPDRIEWFSNQNW
jgi:hypothetical protein